MLFSGCPLAVLHGAPRLATTGSMAGAVRIVARSALASHVKVVAAEAGEAASSATEGGDQGDGESRALAKESGHVVVLHGPGWFCGAADSISPIQVNTPSSWTTSPSAVMPAAARAGRRSGPSAAADAFLPPVSG